MAVVVWVPPTEASQQPGVGQHEVVGPRRVREVLPVAFAERDRLDRLHELRHEAATVVVSKVHGGPRLLSRRPTECDARALVA